MTGWWIASKSVAAVGGMDGESRPEAKADKTSQETPRYLMNGIGVQYSLQACVRACVRSSLGRQTPEKQPKASSLRPSLPLLADDDECQERNQMQVADVGLQGPRDAKMASNPSNETPRKSESRAVGR